MPATKEQLQERAQLIRLFEGACQIEHPTDMELRFRESLMRKIGEEFGLRQKFSIPQPPAAQIKK
jgi:hypothetical protein